ncbi:MAG TPA: glycosyl hydrolase family 28-related protein [Chloroflexota bacterium]|nr:glycosyl hydrolase family 28-related protein [Chloroflexota bacterium]
MAPPLRRRATLTGSARVAALVAAPLEQVRPTTNVRDHGARGDGTTDDADAIQAAIDARQRAGGGIVALPEGTYALGRGLRVTGDAVTLLGAGQGATVLLALPQLDGDVLALDGRGVGMGITGGGVRQLTITSAEQRTSGIALHVTDASRILVQDVDLHHMFVGCKIDGYGAVHHIQRGYWSRFAPGGVGLWIDVVADPPRGGNDQLVSQLVIDNTEDLDRQPYAGIRLTNTQAVWLTECDVLSCRYGLAVDPEGGPKGGVISWLFAQACAFDSCATAGIYVNPALGAVCKGLSFVNCWSSSTQRGHGCYVGGPVDGVELLGHRSLQNDGHGILVEAPAANVSVDASTAAGNRGSGFVFNAADFAVRGSRSGSTLGFGPSQPAGIHVASRAARYLVTDNVLTGNLGRGLLDEGAGPRVVANNLGA